MVQAAADNEAIIATVMDYFEGWFDGNPERMARALHPNLEKSVPARRECSSRRRRLARTAEGWRIVNALYARWNT